MQEYQSKQALIDEIKKTAELFIKEFDDIAEAELYKWNKANLRLC
jgi:hypothetical protein